MSDTEIWFAAQRLIDTVRRAALEEAAEACERIAVRHHERALERIGQEGPMNASYAAVDAARSCAAAVRALRRSVEPG